MVTMRIFDRYTRSKQPARKFPQVPDNCSLCGCCGSEWNSKTGPHRFLEGIHISPGDVEIIPFESQFEQLDKVVTKNGTLNVYVRKQW